MLVSLPNAVFTCQHSQGKLETRGFYLKPVLVGIVLALFFSTGVCEEINPKTVLMDKNRTAIIDSVASIFHERYVYPEMGASIDSLLRSRLSDGVYNEYTSISEFANTIKNDLRDITGDRHISVVPIPKDRWYVVEGDIETENQVYSSSLQNFGWVKLEWFLGAVGYIKVDKFENASFASDIADAALSFMANSKALIIDLREHHGGHENMLQLVASYFFAEPTQLGGLYWTYLDSTQETWTQAYINGTPLYDKDLYLLTSSSTASGAEAFAYRMKQHGRATIIGENTRGAAHWSDWYEFPELGIAVRVPVARPVNPVTEGDWEGTGVIPDIEVPAQKAFDMAYLKALQKLAPSITEPQVKRQLEWTIPAINAKVNPVSLDDNLAGKYQGQYLHPDTKRPYIIAHENGNLRYVHYSGSMYTLTPLTETLFAFTDDENARLQFITNENGDVTEFHLLISDGRVFKRTRLND